MRESLKAVGDHIGCSKCWKRSIRLRRPYEPPFPFENVERVSDPSSPEYELRGIPGALERRELAPLRTRPWEPVDKRWLVCRRCQHEDPTEVLLTVFDVATGMLVEEQSYQGLAAERRRHGS